MTPPRKFSALPPSDCHRASPKAISRRTSYLRVRLEFLPYPHLIATFFNRCAFGPPLPFTATSSWTWIDHPVSGLLRLTGRPIKTWFPFGSTPIVLNLASRRNSPDRSTKSTRLYPFDTSTACKHRVSGSLSLPPGVLFTFPSQYYALSVTKEYLALRGGPRSFPQDFSCLVVLWILPPFPCLSRTGLSPSLAGLPRTVLLGLVVDSAVRTPECTHSGLGSFPFARRYLGNRQIFFLFLRLLRCFSSPGSLRIPMDSVYGD